MPISHMTVEHHLKTPAHARQEAFSPYMQAATLRNTNSVSGNTIFSEDTLIIFNAKIDIDVVYQRPTTLDAIKWVSRHLLPRLHNTMLLLP